MDIREQKSLYLDHNSHFGGVCIKAMKLCSFNGYTMLYINSISIKLKTKIIHAIIQNFCAYSSMSYFLRPLG